MHFSPYFLALLASSLLSVVALPSPRLPFSRDLTSQLSVRDPPDNEPNPSATTSKAPVAVLYGPWGIGYSTNLGWKIRVKNWDHEKIDNLWKALDKALLGGAFRLEVHPPNPDGLHELRLTTGAGDEDKIADKILSKAKKVTAGVEGAQTFDYDGRNFIPYPRPRPI